MAGNHHAKPSKKNRKHNRNRIKCARYRAEGRRERRKAYNRARRNTKKVAA